MICNCEDLAIIKNILSYEHHKVATRLKFINEVDTIIDTKLLNNVIGLIDRFSRFSDDKSKNIVITLSAILWSYKDDNWDGLKDFLVLVLSRIGYAPSSIMVDDGYDHVCNLYSGMSGLINELSVAIHQFEHEITVGNKKFLLTDFQSKVWQKIDSSSILGISAPTSAGKSFIIALKAIDLIMKGGGSIIYIVPTLSLVSQVSIDFRRFLSEFGLEKYSIQNTYNGDSNAENKIYVLTQEKAIGAFGQSDVPFHKVRMLVVDEIQNVERVASEDDQRAKTLYDLMVDFRHSKHPDHIIISGPRIDNIGKLGVEVFGKDTEEEEAKSSPVASITYAIYKSGKDYYFRQYSIVIDEPLSLKIMNFDGIYGTSGVKYMPKFHDYLFNIIKGLGEDSKNIIFSPSAAQARRTASDISSKLPSLSSDKLHSLIDYLSRTVNPNYELCNTLKKGVAYHHGKLPHHVRRVLEKAISEKMIANVVCTTTLMQGVNLPAQNVIIRNPNLFVSRRFGEPILTDYEIANLRGRAGRLLKDFMGRTFVLDGNAFEAKSDDQEKLFDEKTKELSPGYGTTFDVHRDSIRSGLQDFEVPTDINREYSFLLTHIRQAILRHKDGAMARLKSVGIELSFSDYSTIKKSLDSMDVPVRVCLENRYWDPIELNRLFLMSSQFVLPTNAREPNISYKLKDVVELFKKEFPFYSKKYFNIPHNPNHDLLLSTCINAESWLKEKTLYNILNTSFHDDSDKIENTISTLQNRISFGLPMLLKPIYSIKYPENPFLRYIELGAYNPITRRLIEYSVPRETAIHLTKKYFNELNLDSGSFDIDLRETLMRKQSTFDYWVRAQLEVLI
jgi:hypothetical protein